MKAEQRAERIVSTLAEGGAALVDFDWAEGIIARALRAERNAALEEAARECLRSTVGFFPTTGDLRPIFAETVRSLKSPAPSKRKAKL